MPLLPGKQHHLERLPAPAQRQKPHPPMQGLSPEIHPAKENTPATAGGCSMSDYSIPEKEFHVGRVRVTLWTRPRYTADGKTSTTHHITLDRGTKNTSGTWQGSDTLEPDDLPKAILALKHAHDYLTRQTAHNSTETTATPPTPPAAPPLP